MTDRDPTPKPERHARTLLAAPRPPQDDRVHCERCSTEMFRMHAVWRCPSCGYKTDCCGW